MTKRPVPFSVVAGAAWLACAAQAASGYDAPDEFTLCLFRLVTGHRCPGCGMGHAVVSAMRGRWAESFHHHPLGIALLVVWTGWLALELARAVGEWYNNRTLRDGETVSRQTLNLLF